jgi:FkbM family methyltransferase
LTTLRALNKFNDVALLQREAEERAAPDRLKDATLQELLKRPAYIGFVEANFLSDLSFVMFLCDRDDGIALRLLWKREFEPVSLAIWRQLALRAEVVVDVGGHTGIYSIVAGLANPRAVVHTFEPHEMNFGRLLLNLRANGLTGKNAHNLAASRSAGAVPFKVKMNHYLSAGGSVVSADEEFAKMVPAGPLDDNLPLKPRPACVKIDVEGHEVEVLAGMPKFLELTPDIILECAFVPAMSESERYLKSKGYYFFHIDDRRRNLTPIDTLTSPPPGVGASDRENVLITTMAEPAVRVMFEKALDDFVTD